MNSCEDRELLLLLLGLFLAPAVAKRVGGLAPFLALALQHLQLLLV